jgi:hypothetical protein
MWMTGNQPGVLKANRELADGLAQGTEESSSITMFESDLTVHYCALGHIRREGPSRTQQVPEHHRGRRSRTNL